MKFKIYKQGGAQYFDRLPVQDLSFQIKIKGEQEEQLNANVKPRLEEILSEYRKMSTTKRQAQSRGVEHRRASGYGSDLNARMMRKTVYKAGGSFRK